MLNKAEGVLILGWYVPHVIFTFHSVFFPLTAWNIQIVNLVLSCKT